MSIDVSLKEKKVERLRLSRNGVLMLLLFLLLLAAVFAVGQGAYTIEPSRVIALLLNAFGESTASVDGAVLWSLRVPRVLLALLVGAALGLAGATLQALFRNALADPALVGVSSGAATAVAVTIVFGNLVWSAASSTQALLPVVAFLGALLAAWLVYRIGCTRNGVSVAAMLLAGIAVNSLALALIGLASYLATDEQLRTLTFWSLGSLSAGSWKVVGLVTAGVLPALVLMLLLSPSLNLMALGEAEARYLGVRVERVKKLAILAAALAVGASVAFCGIISFVGLVAPHCVRLLAGPDARIVLPGGALLGALLLVVADVAARTLAAPAEIPIGVLTALLGAPFFLFLLLRARDRLVG
ncbi:FecCD family ABC transporter permease [Marinimicrobium sp. ARAG 43.8]|uniref:FecCD family ABC transporter permease n=1 Tax=Marinimicrobium sp. ARAG 43.8 TaxID=3418719 RepID=UPI003CED07D3